MFLIPWWFAKVPHNVLVGWNVFNPFWKMDECRPRKRGRRKTAYNTRLGSIDDQIFYVVITQNIQKDEELCLDYGEESRAERGYDRREPREDEGKLSYDMVAYPWANGWPRFLRQEWLQYQRVINAKALHPLRGNFEKGSFRIVEYAAPPAKKKKKVAYIDLTADSDSDSE